MNMNITPMNFKGDETETRSYLKSHVDGYYVYVLMRPDQSPFYVGKGKGNRVFSHVPEALSGRGDDEMNPFKRSAIRGIFADGKDIFYGIDSFHETDGAALQRETELIRKHGRLHQGGELTNLAGGLGDGPAPLSLERHTATLSGASRDDQTRALNEFFRNITPVESTPVKPLSRFRKSLRHSGSGTQPTAFKKRPAGALVAAALCCDIPIATGARIPRRFVYAGIDAVLENGVCRNFCGIGAVELVPAGNPEGEVFILNPGTVEEIRRLLGAARLAKLGIRW